MPRLRHHVEFQALRVIRLLIRALPEQAAARTMKGLLRLAQNGFGWRKDETQRRLAQVFPEKSEPEREQIREEALGNLAWNVTELLRGDEQNPDWVEHQIDGDAAFASLEEARQAGKGVLLVIAHAGNWDQAGILCARRGIPMCFIARQQKNPLTYGELVRTREQSGGQVLDRDDPKLLRKLLAFLKENGVVAILIDIRARQAATPTHFLGHPAHIANGLGLLAAKSGAEVLPVFLGRKADGKQFWIAEPAQRLSATDPKEARAQLLQDMLDALSPHILKHPGCYFWYNKRWVLDLHT